MTMEGRTGYGATEQPEDQEEAKTSEGNSEGDSAKGEWEELLDHLDEEDNKDPVATATESYSHMLQLHEKGAYARTDADRLWYRGLDNEENTEWTVGERILELKLFELRNELTAERHAAVMQLQGAVPIEQWNGLAHDMLNLEQHERQSYGTEPQEEKAIEWGRHQPGHQECLAALHSLQSIIDPDLLDNHAFKRTGLNYTQTKEEALHSSEEVEARLNGHLLVKIGELVDFLDANASNDAAQTLSTAMEKLIPDAAYRSIEAIDYNSSDENYPFTMDNLVDQLEKIQEFKNLIAEGLADGNLNLAEFRILDQGADHLAECVDDLIQRHEDFQENPELAHQDDVEGERRLVNYLAAVIHLEGLTTGQTDLDLQADGKAVHMTNSRAVQRREEAITGRAIADDQRRRTAITREWIASRGGPDTRQAAG